MKLKFLGWSRAVYSHTHGVKPILGGPSKRYPLGEAGAPLKWDNALSARGKVEGLGLTGDFQVELQFDPQELRNWLIQYVAEQPEEALRLLAEMQAEATIRLVGKKEQVDA